MVLYSEPFNAQSFEGVIIYEDSYESYEPAFSSTEVTEAMGSRREYYVSGGSYKIVNNGSYMLYQIYDQSTNRLYNKIAPSDTLYWADGDSVRHPVINFRKLEKKENVLGYVCDAIEIETTDGTTVYYFNSELKMDLELYKTHYLGSYYFYLNQSGALPLKTVVKNDRFTWTSTAIEVKKKQIDKGVFSIPVGGLKMQID